MTNQNFQPKTRNYLNRFKGYGNFLGNKLGNIVSYRQQIQVDVSIAIICMKCTQKSKVIFKQAILFIVVSTDYCF